MNVPHINDYKGKRIHMIGVGGSSMSGLAEMLVDKGYQVTGSDRTDGYLMEDVRRAGVKTFIGQRAENVRGADLVVYTAAIAADNPERMEADRLGIPSMERAYLLGQLMEGYPESVGICGAHGKTSTTSMLSQILMEGGLDPSIHIGGKLDAIGGSTRIGTGDAFLAEACEFRRSFLEMKPPLLWCSTSMQTTWTATRISTRSRPPLASSCICCPRTACASARARMSVF